MDPDPAGQKSTDPTGSGSLSLEKFSLTLKLGFVGPMGDDPDSDADPSFFIFRIHSSSVYCV